MPKGLKEKWLIAHDPKYRSKYFKRITDWRKRHTVKCIRFVAEYLLTHPCVDCGETDIRFLDFDHVRGRKHGQNYHISALVFHAHSLSKLAKEIEFCDVRCLKCHCKRHRKNSLSWRIKTQVMRKHGITLR